MHVHDNAFFARLPLGCVGGGGKTLEPMENRFRVIRSTGCFRPLSKYHGFFCGATGKNAVFINPFDTPGGLGLEPDQDARRQLVPNLRRLLTRPSNGIRTPGPANDFSLSLSLSLSLPLSTGTRQIIQIGGVGGTRALAHSIILVLLQ